MSVALDQALYSQNACVCGGWGWGGEPLCVCVCERVHVLTLNRLYGQDCEHSAFD